MRRDGVTSDRMVEAAVVVFVCMLFGLFVGVASVLGGDPERPPGTEPPRPKPMQRIRVPIVLEGGFGLDCGGGRILMVTEEKQPGAVILRGEGSYLKDCEVIHQYTGEPLNDGGPPYTDNTGPHAVVLDGCSGCRLENVTAAASDGDGLYVGNIEQTSPPVSGATITGGVFRGGRHGMTIADCAGITIVGTSFESLDKHSTYGDVLFEQGNTGDHLQGIELVDCKFLAGGHKACVAGQMWKTTKPWDITIVDPVFGHRVDRKRPTGGYEVFRRIEFSCKGSTAPGEFKVIIGGSVLGGEPWKCIP